MDAVESLIARLGLDTSEFKEGMVRSADAVQGLNQKMDMLAKGAAAGAIGEFLRRTMESAAQVVHFADNVGVSTDALQAFNAAAHDNSVSQEEAQRVWQTTKSRLDELRSGIPGAIEDFGRLGLSVRDFKGLNLDQALERIARAYVENQNRAGAFAAVQDLVGARSKNLTSTLIELGEEGFGAMIRKGKEQHEVIEELTLRDLERVNREWEKQGNIIKAGSAEIVGTVTTVVSGLSGAFAVMISRAEQATGFWAKIKAVAETVVNPMGAVAESAALSASSAEKQKKSIDETLPPLKEATALADTRAKLEEAVAKAARESATVAEQIASIEAEIAKHKAAAAAAGDNALQYQKELTDVARLEGELRKLNEKSIENSLKKVISWIDQERALLPLQEQEAKIIEKQEAVLAAINALNAKRLDSSKERAQLDALGLELDQHRQKVADELLKSAGGLLSSDQQTVATSAAHLELLQGKLTKEQAMAEVQMLLAKSAAGLTEEEQIKLKAMFEQLTVAQKLAALNPLMLIDAKNLTEEQRAWLEVLKRALGIVSEVKKEMQAVISLGAAKAGGGVRTYNDPAEQAEYERQLVESATQQIMQDIASIEQRIAAYRTSGSTFGQFEISALQQQLAALNMRRQNVRDYVFNPSYSDIRGQGLFAEQVSSIGDPLGLQGKTNDKLGQIANGIVDLNQRLLAAGYGKNG